jgi:hypothetical protein
MANGQRPARTAQDVAQLEADNEYLYGELERVQRELALVTADRSRLQIENAMLEGKSRENLLRATRMETIINVHSAGLVAAMKEFAQERVTERAVRRHIQEQQLEEETGAAPTFLRRPAIEQASPENTVTEPRTPDTRELNRAAELVARPALPVKQGRIDPTLADRDPRMPGGPFKRADAGELNELAGTIKSS